MPNLDPSRRRAHGRLPIMQATGGRPGTRPAAAPGVQLRAVRAALFTALCTTLSAASHVLLSRAPLPPAPVVAIFAGVFAAAYALTGRERGYGRIAALLVPLELAADTVFTAGQHTCYGGPAARSPARCARSASICCAGAASWAPRSPGWPRTRARRCRRPFRRPPPGCCSPPMSPSACSPPAGCTAVMPPWTPCCAPPRPARSARCSPRSRWSPPHSPRPAGGSARCTRCRRPARSPSSCTAYCAAARPVTAAA